ncbi:sarcoplasmic calcium-binding protein 1 [Caerostris extrusa]|uniref:Sarcoplasmic calcium-binding protein 1 n=1 Tax=Caerostris extrusa TaxID=172846 RepID=A0AAV4VAK0_CAEEX|nr:sarcoplasmic calcium-binding protein 1 [Caerostris extrusa]
MLHPLHSDAIRTTFQQNNGEYNEDIHRKYLTHSKQMWESLCNDVGGNKDGKVHFQDLVNFLYELTSRTRHFEELPDFLQNLAIEVFHMIDKKCDIMWDRDEYRFGSVIWCYVTELKEIDKAFESMLSIQRACDGIFTSLDANTPSRNIFGPLDPNMADEILCRAAPCTEKQFLNFFVLRQKLWGIAVMCAAKRVYLLF